MLSSCLSLYLTLLFWLLCVYVFFYFLFYLAGCLEQLTQFLSDFSIIRVYFECWIEKFNGFIIVSHAFIDQCHIDQYIDLIHVFFRLSSYIQSALEIVKTLGETWAITRLVFILGFKYTHVIIGEKAVFINAQCYIVVTDCCFYIPTSFINYPEVVIDTDFLTEILFQRI